MLALGGLQGHRQGHDDGDVEVDERAEHRGERENGGDGRNPGAAVRDNRAGQGPERAKPAGERGRQDDRGQGGERADGGSRRGGCRAGLVPYGDGREDDARRPQGNTEEIPM
jgi:hypothetical protein